MSKIPLFRAHLQSFCFAGVVGAVRITHFWTSKLGSKAAPSVRMCDFAHRGDMRSTTITRAFGMRPLQLTYRWPTPAALSPSYSS